MIVRKENMSFLTMNKEKKTKSLFIVFIFSQKIFGYALKLALAFYLFCLLWDSMKFSPSLHRQAKILYDLAAKLLHSRLS